MGNSDACATADYSNNTIFSYFAQKLVGVKKRKG